MGRALARPAQVFWVTQSTRNASGSVPGLKGGGVARNTLSGVAGGRSDAGRSLHSSNTGVIDDSAAVVQSFMLQCSYAAAA